MSGNQFVEIYHPGIPGTAAEPAQVAAQALDEWYAKGWLLVDPDAPPPVTDTPYYTTAAADSRFAKVDDFDDPETLTGERLRAASVAAVEDEPTVSPTGAWDFATAPTVAGAPINTDSGGATDAELRDRSTHTGTQTAATISDLREQVEDYVAALLGAGTNVTLTYTDNGEGTGSLTIAATGGGTTDPEAVRDAIGIALVGAGLISVAVNDAGDTITISTTATANSTDAQLRDRTTHTGVMPISGAAAYTLSYVDQNPDGTWPNRRTSRTDVKVIWTKVVVGSADPASVTSPAVNGAYANDLVVGV